MTPIPPLKLVLAGHVDHGKSTLIGRLLYETGALPETKAMALAAASARRGVPTEWSFALDALQAERDQAVTVDTSRVTLRLGDRPVVIIDAPGHREFIAKMVSGAADADAAVLVVDAAEGIGEETRRHAYLLRLLGIAQLAVAINKLDLVGYGEDRFRQRAAEVTQLLASLDAPARAIVPVSARHGDNLVRASANLQWHEGPTLVEAISSFAAPPVAEHAPLRLPIQDVYRHAEKRILVGRLEAGRLAVGDMLLFSPSNKQARVRSIEAWPGPAPGAVSAGASVGLTLDRPLFIERGEVASHNENAPVLARRLRATLLWLSATPLYANRREFRLHLRTSDAPVAVERIERVVDTGTMAPNASGTVERDQVAEVVLRSPALLALDDRAQHPRGVRFVLRDGGVLVGAGLISLRGVADERPAASGRDDHLTPVAHKVTRSAREGRFGHKGGVLWLTCLPGAGKSSLAMALEQQLFQRGYAVYVLDGDNIRSGLNANLGFAPEDRIENIRRVGEVAALFADAGFLCITAFISPYRADRARARAATPPGSFHEIYVNADLATCEARDPKGLYRRARAGEIADFTGISAPYEPPQAPALALDTAGQPLEACLEQLLGYVAQHFALLRA